MYTIQIQGGRISRDELEGAIFNTEYDTFNHAQGELVKAFFYLRNKFGSAFVELKHGELHFDCAYAEIVNDEEN